MARHTSFVSIINQAARSAAAAQRQQEASRRRLERENLRSIREAEKLQARFEKEAKQLHIQEMTENAELQTEEVNEVINEISLILSQALETSSLISFDSLLQTEEFKKFNPPADLTKPKNLPDKNYYEKTVKAPGVIAKQLPWVVKKYKEDLLKAEEQYNTDLDEYMKLEEKRHAELKKLEEEYCKEKLIFEEQKSFNNSQVEELKNGYFNNDPDAIVAYYTIVLERSQYPNGFPQEFRVAFEPASQELVIDYELPNLNIIPIVEEFRYVKSKDTIEEKPRKPTTIKDFYQDLVASITLRSLHEIFEADQCDQLKIVVFNGFVQTVDPATGQNIRPYLISIRVTKENFKGIDLSRVDKKACLRNLGAQVSPRPAEMQAIKPIIEFDMVDKRYVEQSDVLADLESRPNLMDLNPFEFENLVSNLFTRMGLETKQTRSSKDGGVDAVAFDLRPILGGKVIIQAKRYKNPVGVSAVRDLYGTMMNEGANKGILVTTSGYGPDAFDFAKDKPIELIDGSGLLYLLDQVGVKARIIFPED